MLKTPLLFPAPEIIDDLLIDNWELRWQVLDIFHQTKLQLKKHPSSSAKTKLNHLMNLLINTLQGENDKNLNLIALALFFLDGRAGIFKLLNKLGMVGDESELKELSDLQKRIIIGDRQHTFFHYFQYIFQHNFFDSAITLCRRWFSGQELFQLFLAVHDPGKQAQAFLALQQQFPQIDFNELVTADNCRLLKDNPRLVIFLKKPLSQEIQSLVEKIVFELLPQREQLELAMVACRNLKIEAAEPFLIKLLADKDFFPAACMALGAIGSQAGLSKVLKASRSLLRSSRKIEAITLLGYYQLPETLKTLKKLVKSRKQKVRESAYISLSRLGSQEALEILIECAIVVVAGKEKKQLLQIISNSYWKPQCSVQSAGKLIDLAGDVSLAPEIFQALENLGRLELLVPTMVNFAPPLKNEYQKTMCLFLARQADNPEIKKLILPHLAHPDWGFSYCLLNLLRDHFTIEDFPVLFNLLQLRESYKPLTIKERLELGKGEDEFVPSMCIFFNQHQDVVEQLLFNLINDIVNGKLPAKINELEKIFADHGERLKQLIYSFYTSGSAEPEVDNEVYFLLLFCRYLDQITIDGASSFAVIVNSTRKYSGFFSQSIWFIVRAVLQAERKTTDTAHLPYLDQLLKILHGRQGVDDLRQLALTIKKRIFSLSRDLYVFTESSQYRDILVIKVKKNYGY